jgi:hypothetical protein
MRHLIAPSSMLGVVPTSIHSSSQKGMRTHRQSLSRTRRDTPSLGHFGWFPPPKLSVCCRLTQPTFAQPRGNAEDAPFPGVRVTTIGRLMSTHSRHSPFTAPPAERLRSSAPQLQRNKNRGYPITR